MLSRTALAPALASHAVVLRWMAERTWRQRLGRREGKLPVIAKIAWRIDKVVGLQVAEAKGTGYVGGIARKGVRCRAGTDAGRVCT